MLDFSWSHILIVLIVALVVVGPKDLPRLMNMAGKWAGKARAMANDFKKSFDDMARQSELDELRAEIEKLRANDPVADLQSEVEKSLSEVDTSFNAPADVAADQAAPPSSAAQAMAPAPRSGEYQVAETAAVHDDGGSLNRLLPR